MEVVLVIHLILALGIIALVLLQRSEGGGLGIGGSGGGLGGLATPQGTASVLTRTTAILAACFFATSLVLGILAGQNTKTTNILDTLEVPVPAVESAVEDIKDELPSVPSAPVSE